MTDRLKEVRAIQGEFGRYRDASKVLATNSDDPRANLAVGKFLAFHKRDYAKGWPALAKSADPALAPLAKQEMTPPEEAADQAKLGEAWGVLADRSPADVKPAAQRRAQYWLSLAAPKLQGLARLSALKRLRTLPPSIDFDQLAERIKGGLEKTGRSGKQGAWGPVAKADEPGLLVGFDYSLISWDNHVIVKTLRPIFQTANGRVRGPSFGALFKGREWQTIEAKPGYAVGTLVTDSDNKIDGMKLTFMPVHGATLDPDAGYDSPWIGTHINKKMDTFGGDGRPVIGAQITAGHDSDAVGLVLTAK